MGNLFSSPDDAIAELRNLVERPGDPEISLTSDAITKGLDEVAAHLKDKNLTIVAVGGAVNTLYLKSRTQTSDVDFFYQTKLRNDAVTAIIAAAKSAAKVIKVGDQWLNNHTAIFIEEKNIGPLYDEAVAQNAVIYEKKGVLRIVAAPWRYALICKLDRMSSGGGNKAKDMGDAVAYLNQMVAKNGHPTKRQEIQDWAIHFGMKSMIDAKDPTKPKLNEASTKVITELATAYKVKHKKDGITG